MMDVNSVQREIDQRRTLAEQELAELHVGQMISCWLSANPRCKVLTLDPQDMEITVEVASTSRQLGIHKGQTLTFVPEYGVPGRWISKEQITPDKGFSEHWLLVIINDHRSYGPPEHAYGGS